eukprot:EG_transcript_14430
MLCCICVPEKAIGFKEKYGEFDTALQPGLHCLLPGLHRYAGHVDLRLQCMAVQVECKTRDHTFVGLTVHVQHRVASVPAAGPPPARPQRGPDAAGAAGNSSSSSMNVSARDVELQLAQTPSHTPVSPSAAGSGTPLLSSFKPGVHPVYRSFLPSGPILPADVTPDSAAYRAFYGAQDMGQQLLATVQDCVRGCVPSWALEELFTLGGALECDILERVNRALQDSRLGVVVDQLLVVNVTVPPQLRDAIHANKIARLTLERAAILGETQREVAVTRAEGLVEQMRLEGSGLAAMRGAVLNALGETVDLLDGPGTDPAALLHQVRMLQYFDMLAGQAAASEEPTMYLPMHPGQLAAVRRALRIPQLEAMH